MTDQAAAESFSGLYEETYGLVFRYFRRRDVSIEDARDLASEVFTVAWRRWDEVPTSEGALPWLYRCADFHLRNFRRKHRDALATSEEPSRNHADHANEVQLVDELQVVRAGLSTLSSADREILTLTAWEGLSLTEAASVLGCKTNAAGVRLHRARRRLRQAMEKATRPEREQT